MNNTPLNQNVDKEETRSLVHCILLLLFVLLLPYISRIWNGADWVGQYLPSGGGLLFFACFNALPSIPVIAAYATKKRTPFTFWLLFVVTTIMLIVIHYDYDLASDAQAAIGLVVFPVFICVVTVVLGLVSALIEGFVRKAKNSLEEEDKTQ